MYIPILKINITDSWKHVITFISFCTMLLIVVFLLYWYIAPVSNQPRYKLRSPLSCIVEFILTLIEVWLESIPILGALKDVLVLLYYQICKTRCEINLLKRFSNMSCCSLLYLSAILKHSYLL